MSEAINRAIAMLQDYKYDLASQSFRDNDEGDMLQRRNENKRSTVEVAIAGLRAELSAIKAGQGEAVAWRDHSINYAKGDKCPATIETLQAAWDRDQELMLDQKAEISRLKETINQLRQRRTAPSATADAVSVPRELLERAMWPKDGSELIKANRELRALLARGSEQ